MGTVLIPIEIDIPAAHGLMTTEWDRLASPVVDCDYCGRLNIRRMRCEGCGAPPNRERKTP